MKRVVGVFFLVGLLLVPSIAGAADQLGVYGAVKLGMSIENLSDRKFNSKRYAEDNNNFMNGFSFKLGSDSDTALAGGLAFGYNLKPQFEIPVRVEVDYTARSEVSASGSKHGRLTGRIDGNDFNLPGTLRKKDDVLLQTLLLNAWLDIPTGTEFTPYLGGGIGWGFIDHEARVSGRLNGGNIRVSQSKSDDTTNFAWSLGCGVAYSLTDNWDLDLGYRYVDAGTSKVSLRDEGQTWATSKVSVDSHDVLLGLRYTF